MLIVGAYIVVAIIIFIVVWAIMRRRAKKTSTWDLKKQFADLEAQQQQILKG
jgi:large-conductance mechanosensitive channel